MISRRRQHDGIYATVGEPKLMKWITASHLESWARTNVARGSLPGLIASLVRGSAREMGTIRFPKEDKAQIHGFDGHLVANGVPFLSDGESFWELGCGEDYIKKANSDIKERSDQTPVEKRADSTFVFATPRTWNESGENELQRWREKKRQEFGWKDVVVIDSVMLEDWLEQCPPVASRYARLEFHVAPQLGARSTDEFWDEYASRFKSPLTESLLLCQREAQSKEVLNHLRPGNGALTLLADSPEEAVAFAIAAIRTADPEVRAYLESRTIVLDTDEAARELAERSDLIFVPRGKVTISGRLARSAPTIVAIGRDQPERRGYVSLERPTTQGFAEAIKTMGVPEDEAYLMAHTCGRSVTILMRTFSNGTAGVPEWATGDRILVPALLAGAWDSAHLEDKTVLGELAATDYEKYEEQLRRFRRMQDPLLDHEDGIWKIRAPVDAFVHLAHLLGGEDFDRLRQAVISVFSEIDPSLNAETPTSTFDQPKPRHSSWLREGLAITLLQIAVHHEGADVYIKGTTPQAFVDDLIKMLPGLSSDWRLIASLRAGLPLLMEAAPRPFLEALELLLREGAALRPIFREGGFFSPFSPHTYLLWALEALAWDPEYLARVSLILAKLARLDPGGTLSNRPENSLTAIFLPWHPSTNAPQEQRLATLDLIAREVPEIGWTLLAKLLPTVNSIGHYTYRPKYREAGGSAKEQLTYGMLRDAYDSIVSKAFSLAEADPDRWSLLVRHMPSFNAALRSKMRGLLEGYLAGAPEKAQRKVWTALRDEVNRHVAFKDAKWALPADELQPFFHLLDRFAPSDPIERISWLFDEQFPHLPSTEENPEQAVAAAREQALIEMIKVSGMSSILTLANSVKMPHLVAFALRSVEADLTAYEQLFQTALGCDGKNFEEFSAALSAEAYRRFPETWGESFRACVVASHLPVERIVSLLQYWPDQRATWEFVASLGKNLEQVYWSKKQAWPIRGELSDLTYAAEHYLEVKRSVTAIQSLGEGTGTLPVDLVFRLLDSAVTEVNENATVATGMFTYYLEHILDAVEERGEATVAEIARREWAFFPLFEHHQSRGLRLHRIMLEDPGFYVSLLSAVFRAEGEEISEPTEEERARATAAYQLLRSFGAVPGAANDSVDVGRLRSWVGEVLRQGEAAGLKAMSHEFIGHVLAHSPKDKDDQAWPDRAVREVLETLSSDEVDLGIRVERINMRGGYAKAMFEGGKQERAIAEETRMWAKKCAAWPRAQKLLNDSANYWEEDAEREDARARKERMRD
jgi:hypothetical protein